MLDIWQHLMTHSKGMGGRLNQSWVRHSTMQMCFPLHCMVKWMCWRSIIFAITSAENLVKWSQKSTRCYKKHGEKQQSQSNTFEGYSSLRNGHTYGHKWRLWWLLSLTWRVPKATTWIWVPIEYPCSAFTMWFVRNALTNGFCCLASEQCAILSSPKCGEVLGYGLHPIDSAYALTDSAPATSSCSPGQKSPWKGKRFQVITELQLHVTLQLQVVPKQT